MTESLRKKKVTGEVLAAYDERIRRWVGELLRNGGTGGSGGTSDVPSWVKQVVTIDSEINIKNVNELNAIVAPDRDPSVRTPYSIVVWIEDISGIRIGYRAPGVNSGNLQVYVFKNRPVFILVTYDDLGAWVELDFLGSTYRFRSLDSNQENFEYDPSIEDYYLKYTSLATKKFVQEAVNKSIESGLTEERVQEMIDASVGAAISDSY